MSCELSAVWQAECLLGEGPLWVVSEQALRFVDIKRGHLHRFVPKTGACETIDVGGKPSFILSASDGSFLVGSEHRIWTLNNDRLDACVAVIDQPAHNRTNDGTVDTRGRLWFGTMDDDERQPSGAIYCLDSNRLHRVGGEAIVTNGPAVSADAQTLYHVDSGNRTIWRSMIGDGPALSHSTILVQLGKSDGYPDGIILDSEGCLWVALWDGWGVRRYAPDGRLMAHLPLPCARATKVAFGGGDLRTLFVTTARIGLTADELAAQPLAGSLFAINTDVAGLPMPAFHIVS